MEPKIRYQRESRVTSHPLSQWLPPLVIGVAISLSANPSVAACWDSDWNLRRTVVINNDHHAKSLEAGYTVSLTLDTQGPDFLNNGDDIRIVYNDAVELHRVSFDGFNSGATTIRFSLKAAISPGESDSASYALYHSNPLAGAPLADPDSVFLFFDSFEEGLDPRWDSCHTSSGIIGITDEQVFHGDSALEVYQTVDNGNIVVYLPPSLVAADSFRNVAFEMMYYDDTRYGNQHLVGLGNATCGMRSFPRGCPREDVDLLVFGVWGFPDTDIYTTTGCPRSTGWHDLEFLICDSGSTMYHDDRTCECTKTTRTAFKYFAIWDIWRGTPGYFHDLVRMRKYICPEPTLELREPVPLNSPPVAQCCPVTVDAGPDCMADASINCGSYDPDGDSIIFVQVPPGPYPLGETEVTLIVTDIYGAADSCLDTVTVEDNENPVMVDVKPQSCPNPLNIRSRGVVPAAILGSENFDIAEIDPATVTLEGVPALRWDVEDVSTPVGDTADTCACNAFGGDGYSDLTLKFDKGEIVAALGAVDDGDLVPLTLTGQLLDGTPIGGTDCLLIRGRGNKKSVAGIGEGSRDPAGLALGSYPNPFNATTVISYTLETGGPVELGIYDVMGRRLLTLINGVRAPGRHQVPWDGTDGRGRAVASGMYFYRLTAGDVAVTKKMILLK